MIDSVTYKSTYMLRQTNAHGPWRIFKSEEITGNEDHRASASIYAEHKGLGITLKGEGDEFDIVHIDSLPKVLYGHNGKLITDNNEIYAALRMVEEAIDQIAGLQGKYCKFTRVDLVWQFAIPYSLLETVHGKRRQPGAHSDPVPHPGESLEIPLVNQRISIYEKTHQLRGKRKQGLIVPEQAEVSRCEIQLRGDRISKQFATGDHPLRTLDIDQCYKVFRSILLEAFPGGSEVFTADSLKGLTGTQRNTVFLAMVATENPELYGLLLQSYSDSQKRKLRKEVGAMIPQLEKCHFDWRDQLPEDRLPEAVEVQVEGAEPFDPITVDRILRYERSGKSPFRGVRFPDG